MEFVQILDPFTKLVEVHFSAQQARCFTAHRQSVRFSLFFKRFTAEKFSPSPFRYLVSRIPEYHRPCMIPPNSFRYVLVFYVYCFEGYLWNTGHIALVRCYSPVGNKRYFHTSLYVYLVCRCFSREFYERKGSMRHALGAVFLNSSILNCLYLLLWALYGIRLQ